MKRRTGLLLTILAFSITLCAEPAVDENPARTLRAEQRHLRSLGAEPGPGADRELSAKLDELEAGRLPLALWLDVLEAAARRDEPGLRARLAERARRLAASPDPLRQWRECLEGGDASEGREIFREQPAAGCIRCHRIKNEGGEIGPDLTSLAQRAQRISILESIVDPSAYIVMGFKNELIKLKDGRELSGLVTAESADLMTIKSPVDGKTTTIRTSDIQEETGLPSAMPPGFGAILGKRAIRDLVEFLARQE